jgi:hypothetical protein
MRQSCRSKSQSVSASFPKREACRCRSSRFACLSSWSNSRVEAGGRLTCVSAAWHDLTRPMPGPHGRRTKRPAPGGNENGIRKEPPAEPGAAIGNRGIIQVGRQGSPHVSWPFLCSDRRNRMVVFHIGLLRTACHSEWRPPHGMATQ